MKEEPSGWQKILDAIPRPKKTPWENFGYTVTDVTASAIGKAVGNTLGGALADTIEFFRPKPKPFAFNPETASVDDLLGQAKKIVEAIETANPDPADWISLILHLYKEHLGKQGLELPLQPVIAAQASLLAFFFEHATNISLNADILRDNTIHGARERDNLRAYIATWADTPKAQRALSLFSLQTLIALDPHIPRIARRPETNNQGFSVPLHDLFNLGEAILSLLAPLHYVDAKKFSGLNELREQLNQNLYDASNVSLGTERPKLIYPDTYQGGPSKLIEAYLGGTPYRDIFAASIPFPLTSYKKKHWAIYGRTGHGKTQLLQALILSHLKEPDPPPMIIIDSQGQMLKNIEQLALWDNLKDRLVVVDAQAATPPALNIFATPKLTEEAQTEVISLYEYIFSALDADLTRRQSTMFTFVTQLMMKHKGSTIRDLLKLLEEGRGSRTKFPVTQSAYYPTIQTLDPVAQDYFANRFFDTAASPTKEQISTRLYALLSVRQVGRMLDTPQNKLNLFDAINKRQTVLVNTAGLGLWTPLFGRIIIALALQAAFQRDISNEPDPALLFIDEAADLMDEKINRILIQARKFGLFIRFATQNYDQIPHDVKASASANTEVKLVGGLMMDDARKLAPDMRTDADFLVSMRKYDKKATEFACFVDHELERAVKLTIPFFQLEAEPRRQHDAAALRALLAADPAPAATADPITPPPSSGETKKSFPTEW